MVLLISNYLEARPHKLNKLIRTKSTRFPWPMPSKNMDSAWRPAPDSQPQQGAQSSSEFLWVDCQDGKSQDAAVARNAQAFLQTKYHKMRRQAQLQQLKASMKALPPSKSPSASTPRNENSSEKHDRQLLVIQKDHRVHRSLQPKVEDILPVVSPRVKQSVDFYFDYCELSSWLCVNLTF